MSRVHRGPARDRPRRGSASNLMPHAPARFEHTYRGRSRHLIRMPAPIGSSGSPAHRDRAVDVMTLTRLVRRRFWRKERGPAAPRFGLALSGGGVIGGMYEVGAVAAIEERLGLGGGFFDIYVGCSAGSVVASLLAQGLAAAELFGILDQDLPDPLNFNRGAVYDRSAARRALGRLGRLVWAIGKNVPVGLRHSIPDMLARAERDLPAGFFALAGLERFMRAAFRARDLPNSFAALERTLLIPAVDLDRGERVVFGLDGLQHVAITHAIAASSAIPGFFEPYSIEGRDYIDGGVGWSGHADLAAEAGANTVLVIHPLVPAFAAERARAGLRRRGLYAIMEQANRIGSQNL